MSQSQFVQRASTVQVRAASINVDRLDAMLQRLHQEYAEAPSRERNALLKDALTKIGTFLQGKIPGARFSVRVESESSKWDLQFGWLDVVFKDTDGDRVRFSFSTVVSPKSQEVEYDVSFNSPGFPSKKFRAKVGSVGLLRKSMEWANRKWPK